MIYNDLKKHCIHNCIQITDEFSGILIFTKYTNCIEGFCRWVAVPWKVFSIPLSEWNNHRGRSRHMSKVCEIIAEASTEFCRPVEPVCNRKCVSNHWNLDFSKKKKHWGALSDVLHVAEWIPSIGEISTKNIYHFHVVKANHPRSCQGGHSTMAPLMCMEKAVSCLSKVHKR